MRHLYYTRKVLNEMSAIIIFYIHLKGSHNLIPIRMAAIKKKNKNNNCWQEYGETGTLVHCGWDCKIMQLLWKAVWYLQIVKNINTIWSFNPTSGYPKNWEQFFKEIICTPMFKAALFTTAKRWKHPKCLSMNEWIKIIWYIHTVKKFSLK